MAKLNQVVAVVASKKKDAEQQITAIYHILQKDTLFQGITKTYSAIVDGAEELPAEKKLLQATVPQCIKVFRDTMTPVFDTVLTQDMGNTFAKADIEIDGAVILKDVPATYLLFLEKKLTDLQTFVSKLPILDPGQNWAYDNTTDSYAADRTWKYHTRKEPKIITKAPASDKHPAQVELVHEDRNVGKWETTNYSGAVPAKERHELLTKVKKLLEATKKAREQANLQDVTNQTAGDKIFDYVFGKAV